MSTALGRRERTKAANRAAILDAAREVFAEQGYEAASVRDIIRRTDLASGTFYNYFPDKDAIFGALDRGDRRGGAPPRPRRPPQRGHAAEFVEGGYRAFFEFIVEDPERFAFMRRNLETIRNRFGDDRAARRHRGARGGSARGDRGRPRAAGRRRLLRARDDRRRARAGRRLAERTPPDVDGATRFASALFLGALARLYAEPSADDRRGPAAVLAGDHVPEHRVLRAAAASRLRGVPRGRRRVAPRAHAWGGTGGGRVARELGAAARGGGLDVAIAGQVSAFTGLVALSLERGARVVCAERRLHLGAVAVPRAGAPASTLVPLESVAEAIDGDTALVAVSAVQSVDGGVADLDAIAAAAAHHGALTCVDATQASGWLPLDAARFDFMMASAYKWLLYPRGTSFMAVRPEAAERLRPHLAGWYAGDDPFETNYGAPLRLAGDARRFDVSPAWLSWVGAAPALSCSRTSGSSRSTSTTSASRTASGPGSGCRRATRRSSLSTTTPRRGSGCGRRASWSTERAGSPASRSTCAPASPTSTERWRRFTSG